MQGGYKSYTSKDSINKSAEKMEKCMEMKILYGEPRVWKFIIAKINSGQQEGHRHRDLPRPRWYDDRIRAHVGRNRKRWEGSGRKRSLCLAVGSCTGYKQNYNTSKEHYIIMYSNVIIYKPWMESHLSILMLGWYTFFLIYTRIV